MPISDDYVAQFLLQETSSHPATLIWSHHEGEQYKTHVNGVGVELCVITGRAGPRLFLTISASPERIEIYEPMQTGMFRGKYSTEADARLAELLRRLANAVARQCAQRLNRTEEALDTVRESIYRRLTGMGV